MRTILLLTSSLALASADAGVPFHPDGHYDEAVPAPAASLGFELGARPARHAQIIRYVEALAEASPNARLERYARSHEGRELVTLIVSSAKNFERLDEIRAAVELLGDPRRDLDDDQLERLLDDTPAVAYLAYAIHGDELSSADAALRVAYELAAGQDDRARGLRDDLVVLIDPCENPDGRERILAMTAAYRGAVPNPDPDSLNHTAFWPWGRGNHYLFDLNRDWFALVHPESQGRADLLRTWRPQLVVDSHEMGSQSTYLFTPPRAPFNPNLPAATRSWWDRYSADQSAAFDEHGWSYYTREWNEEFFPGYGSALPLYTGALGILYEQAGTDGGPVRKQHGGTLTYGEAVHHHFVSSVANLETLARNRRQALESFREARSEAIERGRKGTVRAFYIAPEPDPARAAELASKLIRLGIETERSDAAGTLRRARSPWADGARDAELPGGSYRIRLDQPLGLLARAILEPHTPMEDAPLAEEREHLERQKGSRIYDTTAWSPLLASGLVTWWSDRLDDLDWQPIAAADAPHGSVAGGEEPYGWIFAGSRDGAVVLAAKLTARDVRVRAGDRPFRLDDHDYPRGSFLVRREENDAAAVRTALAELAPTLGIDVLTTATARISHGPDLGGGHWHLLVAPRIAIAAGSPLDFTSVGAAWHALDRELGIRVSLLDIASLHSTDLERYNVLVLPDAWGGADAYARALGEPGAQAIASWIERGGTLVAISAAALWSADPDRELSSVRARSAVLEEFPPPRFGLDGPAIRALARLQATGIDSDGGAVSPAGPYSPESWPEALGIPGPGSPVLGPGTWALLGERGERARQRGSLQPVDDDDEHGDDTGDDETDEERERHDARLLRFQPSGAMLAVELDEEHWLAYGAGPRIAVMVRHDDSLVARDPVRTAARFAPPAGLHVGGLLWPEAAGRIALTAFATRERRGRGQIVLFSDDPNFRGYLWGSRRLFLNAVLLGPGLGTARPVPW